ncbi:MAG: carboxypeptidase-like regulatory domain-containing protein, partial [Paludibacteraceae bacterium]|nr:carboxypeptidase-like regulatory domain-containing protein [Paludibacteraceae bacterium]
MKKRLCCFVLAAMASWFVDSFVGAEDYRGRDAHVPSSAPASAVADAHLTGHVLDAHTGEHLPFVNVQIKGTTIGCLTDESGHYFLKNLPEGKQTVVFSMMGYE